MPQEAFDQLREHPCFNRAAARWFGRIHLPVAPDCNIKCHYCNRLYDCANENRPGVTSRLMGPEEALEYVRRMVTADNRLRVVGVAGPGEPLANKATLDTLLNVHRQFPELITCVSTNGLQLAEKLPVLHAAGVRAVTVTVNAVSPAIGSLIYSHVSYGGRIYRGTEGAELLWRAQRRGLRLAREMGMVVKVNSVLIPGINDSHLVEVARAVKEAGARVMNIIPLIPQGKFAGLLPPPPERVNFLRRELCPIIDQVTHCRRCRADAVGMLV